MSEKGLSEFVSHVLVIAIAFVILAIVSSTMYNYYRSLVLQSQKSEAMTASKRIGDKIMRMYSKYETSEVIPQSGETVNLASTRIDVPDRIAGRNYNLHLNSSKAHWIDAKLRSNANISVLETRRPTARIVVEVTEFPQRSYTYRLYNIEINTTGTAERPNEIQLIYSRKKTGENVTDTIEMTRTG